MPEADEIRELFNQLVEQAEHAFPQQYAPLDAPTDHGVYVIRCPDGQIKHVGRTVRAQNGINQRLRNHLQGQSSFAKSHLGGDGAILRGGYTYQYLVVSAPRARALLEHFAVGVLCPAHLGLGTGE